MELDNINCIQKIIKEMIEIQTAIISIIDDKESLNSLLDKLHQFQIFNDIYKFHDFLELLNQISSSRNIAKEKDKVNEIILNIKAQILKTFSKDEIFHSFKNNTPILLFLYENGIIDFDQISVYRYYELYRFLMPEYIEHEGSKNIDRLIKELADPYKDKLNQFRIDRKEYHSDSTIAKIIRSDDVDSFSDYISRTNLPLDFKIPDSIYEVSSDMRYMCNTLIEYAASFGSINIFKYLYCHLDTFPSNILLAAVFGGNFDIIHLLEKKGIVPNQFILFRTILVHRNELYDYFSSNYKIDIDFDLVDDAIRSSNYYVLNELLNNNTEYLTNINYISSIFSSCCCYDIRTLFNILYTIPEINVNIEKEIIKFFFFL